MSAVSNLITCGVQHKYLGGGGLGWGSHCCCCALYSLAGVRLSANEWVHLVQVISTHTHTHTHTHTNYNAHSVKWVWSVLQAILYYKCLCLVC